jgi:hypothetical protein
VHGSGFAARRKEQGERRRSGERRRKMLVGFSFALLHFPNFRVAGLLLLLLLLFFEHGFGGIKHRGFDDFIADR